MATSVLMFSATTFFCCSNGAPATASISTSTRIATTELCPAMTASRFLDCFIATPSDACPPEGRSTFSWEHCGKYQRRVMTHRHRVRVDL